MTERQQFAPQPGACIHCHGSVYLPYKKAGGGDLIRGFEAVNHLPYSEARKLVSHPVSCIDCHDPSTMQLRVTRPGFLEGIQALASADDAVPNMPSVERWRQGGGRGLTTSTGSRRGRRCAPSSADSVTSSTISRGRRSA